MSDVDVTGTPQPGPEGAIHQTSDAPPPDTRAPAERLNQQIDSEAGEVWDKLNPPREKNGQFTSKEGADQPAATEGEPQELEQPDQPETGDKETAEPAAIPPPQSWSADVKALWDKVPPEAQSLIAKREAEAHAKISEQGQEIAQYEPLRGVIERHLDSFQRNGVSVEQGLAALLEASDRMDSDPVRAIQYFANTYGVDLRQLAGLQPSEQTSPDVRMLLQKIDGLERQLADTTGKIYSREQREAQTQLSSLQEKVIEFSKDKPDWAELEQDTLAEIYGIRAGIDNGLIKPMTETDMLKKAYERAQRNNPEAWAKSQEREKADAEKKRLAEAQKNSKDARRSQPLSVKTSAANAQPVRTMNDTLEALGDKFYGS